MHRLQEGESTGTQDRAWAREPLAQGRPRKWEANPERWGSPTAVLSLGKTWSQNEVTSSGKLRGHGESIAGRTPTRLLCTWMTEVIRYPLRSPEPCQE